MRLRELCKLKLLIIINISCANRFSIYVLFANLDTIPEKDFTVVKFLSR